MAGASLPQSVPGESRSQEKSAGTADADEDYNSIALAQNVFAIPRRRAGTPHPLAECESDSIDSGGCEFESRLRLKRSGAIGSSPEKLTFIPCRQTPFRECSEDYIGRRFESGPRASKVAQW